MRLPLLALRIFLFECADGLDRCFQSPDIQAIPLVEIIILDCSSGEEIQRQRSCALGGAVMVEHLSDGIVYLMCLDLADYLSRGIDVPPRYLEDVDPPFNFFVFETMKKMNSGVFENKWCRWTLSKLLRVSEGVQVEERVHLMKKMESLKGLNGSKSKCYCKECSRSIKRPLRKINKLSYSVPYGTQYLI